MITENLSTLQIHKLTQEQYDRALANNNIDENAIYLTPCEVLSIDDGGTGATDAASALRNFGLTATATELNYLGGVTSNIQDQLNEKVPLTRTVNGKPLSKDIVLSAADVGALPSTTTFPSLDGLATETYVDTQVANNMYTYMNYGLGVTQLYGAGHTVYDDFDAATQTGWYAYFKAGTVVAGVGANGGILEVITYLPERIKQTYYPFNSNNVFTRYSYNGVWSSWVDCSPSTFASASHTHLPASVGAAPASHTHDDYITTLSASGNVITYTMGNGNTGTIAVSSSGGTAGMIREFNTGKMSVTSYTTTGNSAKIYVITLTSGDYDYSVTVDWQSVNAAGGTRRYCVPVYNNNTSEYVNVVLAVQLGGTNVSFTLGAYNFDVEISHICGYY